MAFRLARLLRLYEREQTQCLHNLQAVRQKRSAIAQQITELEAALAAVAPGGAKAGEDLQRNWAYRQATMAHLEVWRERLAVANDEVAQAQQHLMAARQRFKTVQALKEKYEAKIMAEELHKEQTQLDEAGLRLYLAAQLERKA